MGTCCSSTSAPPDTDPGDGPDRLAKFRDTEDEPYGDVAAVEDSVRLRAMKQSGAYSSQRSRLTEVSQIRLEIERLGMLLAKSESQGIADKLFQILEAKKAQADAAYARGEFDASAYDEIMRAILEARKLIAREGFSGPNQRHVSSHQVEHQSSWSHTESSSTPHHRERDQRISVAL
jgi:hypothetical protein